MTMKGGKGYIAKSLPLVRESKRQRRSTFVLNNSRAYNIGMDPQAAELIYLVFVVLPLGAALVLFVARRKE
jgi:hypothetical protein